MLSESWALSAMEGAGTQPPPLVLEVQELPQEPHGDSCSSGAPGSGLDSNRCRMNEVKLN